MAQICCNCKKSIGIFGGTNEIIIGSGRLLCDACYGGFGIFVNMLRSRTEVEGLVEAHTKAIEEVKKSKLTPQIQQQTIDDIEELYKKRYVALNIQETDIQKAEQDNEKNKDKISIDLGDEYTYSTASGEDLPYVVIQVTLKEKLWGTGSKNLTDLENVIDYFARKGYRLHTMSTLNSDSKGFGGGDRVQATLVFEKTDISARK